MLRILAVSKLHRSKRVAGARQVIREPPRARRGKVSRGSRKHPTESLGVEPKTLPEKNTVHAFGNQGQETSGWPYKPTSFIGTPTVGGYLYTPPRLSQSELGARKTRKRRHPTASIGG
jgi:hypothetical protein